MARATIRTTHGTVSSTSKRRFHLIVAQPARTLQVHCRCYYTRPQGEPPCPKCGGTTWLPVEKPAGARCEARSDSDLKLLRQLSYSLLGGPTGKGVAFVYDTETGEVLRGLGDGPFALCSHGRCRTGAVAGTRGTCSVHEVRR